MPFTLAKKTDEKNTDEVLSDTTRWPGILGMRSSDF